MTNVATAIQREPAILDSIHEIVAMGGAMREGGNRSPSATSMMQLDAEFEQLIRTGSI